MKRYVIIEELLYNMQKIKKPVEFFLLTVDLAMGAINRLQAYMMMFAMIRFHDFTQKFLQNR